MKKFHSPNLLAIATLVIASFASAVTAQTAVSEVVGNASSGQSKAAVCIGCHSIESYNSSFPEVHKVPKISGQSAKYLVAALKGYQSGERKHPTMRTIASSLGVQDIEDLASFYSRNGSIDGQTLPETPKLKPSTEVEALLNKGACVSCHGGNFAKPVDGSFPKIAGQHPDYLYVALKSYKVEKNSMIGRGNAVMAGVAKQFSNKELKQLADYIGKLPGDLKVVPQASLR